MNFGQNLYNWFLSNAQSLVLMAIVVIGIYLGFKREFSKLIGFLVIALIAVGLVFNAGGVKDVLLNLFNKIIGAENQGFALAANLPIPLWEIGHRGNEKGVTEWYKKTSSQKYRQKSVVADVQSCLTTGVKSGRKSKNCRLLPIR